MSPHPYCSLLGLCEIYPKVFTHFGATPELGQCVGTVGTPRGWLTPEWGSVGLDRVSREKFHAFGLGSPCWPRRQLAILVSWVLLEGSLVGFVLWRERRKKINPNLKQTCLDPSIAPCHEGSSDKDDNSGEGTGNRSRGVSSSGNGSVNGIGISGCNSSSGSSEISMSRGVSGSANKAGLSESEYDPLESNDEGRLSDSRKHTWFVWTSLARTQKLRPQRALRVLPLAGPGPKYDRQLHQPCLLPGLLPRRGLCPTRGSHSCHGFEAVCCLPLDLDRYAGGRGRVGLDWRPGSERVRLSSARAGRSWGGVILGWLLTCLT